jgi:hypothetical protein
VNDYDAEGTTALLLAMEQGDNGNGLAMMELLLRNGADPNLIPSISKSSVGNSAGAASISLPASSRDPLHVACEANSLRQVMLLLDHKVQRKGAELVLLKGAVADAVRQRLKNEEAAAKAEYDRLEKERELSAITGAAMSGGRMHGYKNKSPWGQWVEYRDKRDGNPFYYNLVTRHSQRDKPTDYTPDAAKVPKDATFGMHFYH